MLLQAVQLLTRKAGMGIDSWNPWLLLEVREKAASGNTASGGKHLFPELFGNDFQRKDQVLGKVKRAIGVVRGTDARD